MRKILFKVDDRVCDECALALRRFIGNMDGIDSIDVEDRQIAIVFDSGMMTDEALLRITTESLENLGHKPAEHWHIV